MTPSPPVTQVVRAAVRVEGIVQGVGFRPFVYALATRLGLAGLVGNDLDGVFAEVEGSPAAVQAFLAALGREAPPLARVDRVTATPMALAGTAPAGTAPAGTGRAGTARPFRIVASEPGGRRRTLIAADTATCADCLRELSDPADRRFRYPFINCTNCGPRFTIVRDVPYDRPLTTMAGFPMCERCATEYHDPANRRFHAQPTCCPACGPRLTLLGSAGQPPEMDQPPDSGSLATSSGGQRSTIPSPAEAAPPGRRPSAALELAARLLRNGAIVAVKGLGGYHLAADAASEGAVAALRARKHREDKPFAVMAADLDAARRLGHVSDAEAELLASPARPIVLLARRPDAAVAAAAAPGNRQLGIMLPYTPLHHLLLREVGRPLVLTSGNVSDEPIAYRDEDALERLAGIADAFLVHDRAIHIRTDDSVARAVGGEARSPVLIRRSRGYVPEPVTLPGAAFAGFPRPVLACGAELKNTFCLAQGSRAFVSHHIGDLENAETLRSFTEGIAHFARLFDITPRVVAHDLHPEYLSTKYALDLDGVDLAGVQHHHAHIASCLADNGPAYSGGPVIGVAFDGTGYGPDGTIWGGEFLIATLKDFERGGHLAPVPMPGGAAAIRQPWRMAAAYLDELDYASHAAGRPQPGRPEPGGPEPGGPQPGPERVGPKLRVAERNAGRWDTIVAMARRSVNAPLTSSAGRLFDAVAAILGVRDEITYEGQAAIELEQLADPAEAGEYRASIEPAAGQPVASIPASGGPAAIVPAGGVPAAGIAASGVPAASEPVASIPASGGPAAIVPAGGPGLPFRASGASLIAAVVADLGAGVPREVIAARFHNGVARLITDGCVLLREQHGLTTVALSGGVFQNLLLLSRAVRDLEAHGFTVLTHSRVPCNDGGISLGQAVVAGARESAG